MNVAFDAGPAVDAVSAAAQEARELALSLVGRAWTREVRLARIRDIAGWNDPPGPTRDQVLVVLVAAICRVIMDAVHQQVAVTLMQSGSTAGRDVVCRWCGWPAITGSRRHLDVSQWAVRSCGG